MKSEKTAHVNLSQAIVVQMKSAAEAGHVTLDELVRQAVQRQASETLLISVVTMGGDPVRFVGGLVPASSNQSILRF